MKKQSTPSKSQGSRVSSRLKRVLDNPPEEVPPANVSKKHPKCCKTSEDTSSPERENMTGLAILPDELLLEILSYYLDSEPELNEDIGKNADAHFARRERLKESTSISSSICMAPDWGVHWDANFHWDLGNRAAACLRTHSPTGDRDHS